MADTLYKLTHTGAQIDSAIDNAVRSDAQMLSSERQTQARTNIGAASAAQGAKADTAVQPAALSNYYTKTQVDAADAGIRGLTATVEASASASKAYAIGDYFVYNGLLYKCTVAIAKGGTITPGTNCTATTAGAEISTLNKNLADCVLLGTLTHPTTGATCTLSESIANYKALYIQYQIADDIRWTKIPIALFLATGAGKAAVQLAQIAAYIYCGLAISGTSVRVTNVTASPANWTDYFTVKFYGCRTV